MSVENSADENSITPVAESGSRPEEIRTDKSEHISTSKLAKRGDVILRTISYYVQSRAIVETAAFAWWLSLVSLESVSCAGSSNGTAVGFLPQRNQRGKRSCFLEGKKSTNIRRNP